MLTNSLPTTTLSTITTNNNNNNNGTLTAKKKRTGKTPRKRHTFQFQSPKKTSFDYLPTITSGKHVATTTTTAAVLSSNYTSNYNSSTSNNNRNNATTTKRTLIYQNGMDNGRRKKSDLNRWLCIIAASFIILVHVWIVLSVNSQKPSNTQNYLRPAMSQPNNTPIQEREIKILKSPPTSNNYEHSNHHTSIILSGLNQTTTGDILPISEPENKNKTRNSSETITQEQNLMSTFERSIPNILIFTHYKQLLESDYSSLNDEEQVLANNIRHSISIHPNATVRFLTDNDCVQSLSKVYPTLIPYFQNETQGMYKADICRGSALYETGGFYLDVDLGVRHDLWERLLPTTQFVTSKVHRESKHPNHFFQAILGTSKQNDIIFEYLRLFERYYLGNERVKGPLGVILLRRAYDNVKKQIAPHHNVHSELWQEVLYHPKFFPNLTPAPTWGTRRACHFVVLGPAHVAEHVEFVPPKFDATANKNFFGFHIPLYSRVEGSRMCPYANATNTTTEDTT